MVKRGSVAVGLPAAQHASAWAECMGTDKSQHSLMTPFQLLGHGATSRPRNVTQKTNPLAHTTRALQFDVNALLREHVSRGCDTVVKP